MRVDAHVHVWDLAVRDQPWTASEPVLRRSFSLDELAPSLDRHQVDGVVLVQTVCVAQETGELLSLAARCRRVMGVVGWVDLIADTLMDAFGPERLMFGSDWPVCMLGGGYDVTIEAARAWLERWSPSEQELVFGGVAARVFGLGAARR